MVNSSRSSVGQKGLSAKLPSIAASRARATALEQLRWEVVGVVLAVLLPETLQMARVVTVKAHLQGRRPAGGRLFPIRVAPAPRTIVLRRGAHLLQRVAGVDTQSAARMVADVDAARPALQRGVPRIGMAFAGQSDDVALDYRQPDAVVGGGCRGPDMNRQRCPWPGRLHCIGQRRRRLGHRRGLQQTELAHARAGRQAPQLQRAAHQHGTGREQRHTQAEGDVAIVGQRPAGEQQQRGDHVAAAQQRGKPPARVSNQPARHQAKQAIEQECDAEDGARGDGVVPRKVQDQAGTGQHHQATQQLQLPAHTGVRGADHQLEEGECQQDQAEQQGGDVGHAVHQVAQHRQRHQQRQDPQAEDGAPALDEGVTTEEDEDQSGHGMRDRRCARGGRATLVRSLRLHVFPRALPIPKTR